MDIRSMNLEEMEALAISLGEKAFRGKQLFQWVHEKQADDFDEMTNLSAAFREKLKENYCISGVRQVEKQVSKKEDTAKYLFALEDDHVIESVWMKYRHGNSVCISSQVGCRMGCTFCASTLTGLTRNLTAGEMLSQIYQIQKDTKEIVEGQSVDRIQEPHTTQPTVVEELEETETEERLPDENKECILIIDDNADVRGYVKSLLKEEYTVIEAADGHAGLKKAMKYVPDAIICDVMMPVMDGLECCRKLKMELHSYIPA